jgi:hypothetical protein
MFSMFLWFLKCSCSCLCGVIGVVQTWNAVDCKLKTVELVFATFQQKCLKHFKKSKLTKLVSERNQGTMKLKLNEGEHVLSIINNVCTKYGEPRLYGNDLVWFIMLLSTIFHLYCGCQFYWWRKPPTCPKSLTNVIT